MLRPARLVAPAALLALALLAAAGCEPTNQGYEPRQPVAYSHAVHAGGAQIDCLYCHYGAERGRFAGIPPASVCMNCHEQIQPRTEEVDKIVEALRRRQPLEWVRVNHLPDHVAFDHSAHVVTGGVECQECHGEVQGMGLVRQDKSLTMGWCLECHRTEQEQPSAVPAAVAGREDAVPPRTRLTDCAVCHH